MIDEWLTQISPDSILLSGGSDIGQIKYRDDLDRRLLYWASIKQKPVSGLCRGMQIMGVHAGGELV